VERSFTEVKLGWSGFCVLLLKVEPDPQAGSNQHHQSDRASDQSHAVLNRPVDGFFGSVDGRLAEAIFF
jgi:hypothetical protein